MPDWLQVLENEGLVLAQTQIVNRSGDQFLSRATFAGDKDGGGARSNHLDEAVNLLHLFRAADQLAQQSGVKASKVVRLRGNVLAVEDSDRVKIAADDGSVYSALLIGVDAPDDKQSYYKKAKKRLTELVEGKEVTVMLRTNEQNESYALVYAGAEDGGLLLIEEGLAWYSPGRSGAQNAADREKYQQAQISAKAAKAGLWDEKDPLPPWTFRGEKSELAVEAATASGL